MKQSLKKKMSVLLAAVTAISLAGCSSEQSESSFDDPLPWVDSLSTSNAYELLTYEASVYDTAKSTDEDKRVKIADGVMTFELTEGLTNGTAYTTIDMNFSLTYNTESGAGDDAGKTDTVTSSVTFKSNSLTVSTSTKTVTLADRDGKDNLSYSITADYVNEHKATFLQTAVENAKPKTLSLPVNPSRDNEMMFYLARAQKIGKSSSTNFKMINLFDSFTSGGLTEYTMAVSGNESMRTVNVGEWVKDFGVEGVTDEQTLETTYPVSCYYTSIGISSENSGPPYIVYFSENPFKQGEREHAKVPVLISYSVYNGSKPYRYTEYQLKSCSFEK